MHKPVYKGDCQLLSLQFRMGPSDKSAKCDDNDHWDVKAVNADESDCTQSHKERISAKCGRRRCACDDDRFLPQNVHGAEHHADRDRVESLVIVQLNSKQR